MEQLEALVGLAFLAGVILIIVGVVKTRDEMKSLGAEVLEAMTYQERKAAKKKTDGRKFWVWGWVLFCGSLVVDIAISPAEQDKPVEVTADQAVETVESNDQRVDDETPDPFTVDDLVGVWAENCGAASERYMAFSADGVLTSYVKNPNPHPPSIPKRFHKPVFAGHADYEASVEDDELTIGGGNSRQVYRIEDHNMIVLTSNVLLEDDGSENELLDGDGFKLNRCNPQDSSFMLAQVEEAIAASEAQKQANIQYEADLKVSGAVLARQTREADALYRLAVAYKIDKTCNILSDDDSWTLVFAMSGTGKVVEQQLGSEGRLAVILAGEQEGEQMGCRTQARNYVAEIRRLLNQ